MVMHMAVQYRDLVLRRSIRSPGVLFLLRYLGIEEHSIVFLLSIRLLVITRYPLMPGACTRSV
jgi:hypothetical protein